MIDLTLNENSGIASGELSVYPSKGSISGFINVNTNGISWYFSSEWRYGTVADYNHNKAVLKDINSSIEEVESASNGLRIISFDNLPVGLDKYILDDKGVENYPTTDGGYTDFKKDIYRVCDRWKQVLEKEYPNLINQITVPNI